MARKAGLPCHTQSFLLALPQLVSGTSITPALAAVSPASPLSMASSGSLRPLRQLISLRNFLPALSSAQSCRGFAAAASGNSSSPGEQGSDRPLPIYDPKYRRVRIGWARPRRGSTSAAACAAHRQAQPAPAPTRPLLTPAGRPQSSFGRPASIKNDVRRSMVRNPTQLGSLLCPAAVPASPSSLFSPPASRSSCLKGTPSPGDRTAAQRPAEGGTGAPPGVCSQGGCSPLAAHSFAGLRLPPCALARLGCTCIGWAESQRALNTCGGSIEQRWESLQLERLSLHRAVILAGMRGGRLQGPYYITPGSCLA